MIFISAGFDAHYEDEMGGLRLLEKDYAWVTGQLKRACRRMRAGADRVDARRRLLAVGAGAQRGRPYAGAGRDLSVFSSRGALLASHSLGRFSSPRRLPFG
jgi:hypothetical protein